MQSNMNINMNALQAVIDNYGFTHIDQPAAVPLEAQILSGYQKAASILSGWDRDAVAKGAFKTPSPAPLPKARAPKVAPLGTMASTGNLIGKIDYALVASSTFAGIQACLRINDVEDGMLPTVEVNQKGLLQHSRRGFSKVGPYVEVTIEANSRIGQVKAHQIMGDGLVISDLAGTKWEGVLWVMSAVEDRKDSICVIMTPGRSIPNFWKLAGYKCKGNPKTILKRLRRIMSDSKIEFVGVLASTFAGVYHCEFGDLVYQQHPCKDSVYMIHTVIIEGKSFVLNTPIEFVVGHLAMNDSDTYRKILGIGDGSHPFAPAHINRIIWAADPKFPGYQDGDGAAVTGGFETGHVKGHGVACYCGHRSLVVLDSKSEVTNIGEEITFRIDRDLHRPRVARTDPQSFNNFRYGRVGILSEIGKEYIARCTAAIGDDEKMDALFENSTNELDYTDTMDAIESINTGKTAAGKTSWVLAANVAMSKQSFYAVSPAGEAQFVDMNGNDGTKMSIWANPRMANRGRRHLTETVLQLKRGRVPFAADKALRAYAMCDITIYSHPDAKYNGLGMYLSQGVLKGRQGLVFNVVLDAEGNPTTKKETVLSRDADGYYTTIEKSHVVYQMVEGPACTHRQPNGWAGEIERFLDLVSNVRYDKMSKSPFIFFSCDLLSVTGELETLLNNLIGVRKLARIVALWGTMVPFIVILNNLLGGGDLDDLHMVYTYDRLVNFLRSQEELDFVASYPNEDIQLDANVAVQVVAATTHQARMEAKMAAARAKVVTEFGRSDWFRILKLMKASGLVAKLSNTQFNWVDQLNEGRPMTINMGGYGRNFEMAIDAEMKTGEDVAGVAKRCDECNAALTTVSRFFEPRLPWAMRQDPTYQVVEGTIDRELAAIQTDLDEFNQGFKNVYLNPNNVQILDYMEAFTPGIQAEDFANAWRKHYNDVRIAVKTMREDWLAGADFNTVDDGEKAAFSIADSVKAADNQSFAQITKALWSTDHTILYKTVIAMFQAIMGMQITQRGSDGNLQDRPDALLYSDKCNTVLREAMRFAKVSSLFPNAPVVAPTTDDNIRPAAQVGPALTVGNRMSKASEEAVAAFVGTAARHAGVMLRYMDPKNVTDMAALWALVPVLKGKQQEAVLVLRRDNDQALYGYVDRSSFPTWHLHAQGCKLLSGMLSRSVNTKTGEFNPFTVQVNLDLV